MTSSVPSSQSSSDSPAVWTIGQLLPWTTEFFTKHEIESPRLDAEILLAHVLKLKRLDLYLRFTQEVTSRELVDFKALIKRRIQNEPVAYLLGTQPFCDLELKVDRRVLIPRPETELLVEAAVMSLSASAHILDIGTGSGAIALSILAAMSDVTAVASDISEEALVVAADNAHRHGLSARIQFRHGSLYAPLRDGERFDAILSNPPYIAASAMLSADVIDYEPKQALFGGEQGIEIIEQIILAAPTYLQANGSLFLECGFDQGTRVQQLAQKAGFTRIEIRRDLSGIERILIASL